MYLLWQLKLENKITDIQYIIDLPMGVSAFDIFFHNSNWHKISVSDCVAISKMFTMITDFRDTMKAINDKRP